MIFVKIPKPLGKIGNEDEYKRDTYKYRKKKFQNNYWKPRIEAEPQQVVDVMPLHCLQYPRSHNVFYIGLPSTLPSIDFLIFSKGSRTMHHFLDGFLA